MYDCPEEQASLSLGPQGNNINFVQGHNTILITIQAFVAIRENSGKYEKGPSTKVRQYDLKKNVRGASQIPRSQ